MKITASGYCPECERSVYLAKEDEFVCPACAHKLMAVPTQPKPDRPSPDTIFIGF